jgi:hypothetical protein
VHPTFASSSSAFAPALLGFDLGELGLGGRAVGESRDLLEGEERVRLGGVGGDAVDGDRRTPSDRGARGATVLCQGPAANRGTTTSAGFASGQPERRHCTFRYSGRAQCPQVAALPAYEGTVGSMWARVRRGSSAHMRLRAEARDALSLSRDRESRGNPVMQWSADQPISR